MIQVIVHLFDDKFTIPCDTYHDALCVIGEWQRLGYHAEVAR